MQPSCSHSFVGGTAVERPLSRSCFWPEVDGVPDKPFYHSAAWKRVRAAALSRDQGMCQDCMDRFRAGYGIRPNRATMVHHIIPVEERPDLALDLSNLRALCDACHNREHPEKRRPWKPAPPRVGKARIIKV